MYQFTHWYVSFWIISELSASTFNLCLLTLTMQKNSYHPLPNGFSVSWKTHRVIPQWLYLLLDLLLSNDMDKLGHLNSQWPLPRPCWGAAHDTSERSIISFNNPQPCVLSTSWAAVKLPSRKFFQLSWQSTMTLCFGSHAFQQRDCEWFVTLCRCALTAALNSNPPNSIGDSIDVKLMWKLSYAPD
jgi:hypothetical protein